MNTRLWRAPLACAAAALAAAAASAAVRTTVSLEGSDPAARKLGMPGIAVAVRGPAEAAAAIEAQLVHDFATLVYTRALEAGEAGDYDLTVTLAPRRRSDAAVTLPFDALLTSAEGAVVWRSRGTTEVTDAPVDAAAFASIARNVLSALIHDGWVAPRYDVNDPPPAAPEVRRD